MTAGFLVDTNVLSEVRKGARAQASVRAWWSQVAPDALYTSVLVLGELRRGIERLRVRDAMSAMAIDTWHGRVCAHFGDRILPVDREVSEQWGRWMAVTPLAVVDGLLAATAKVHDLVLVTRNVKDVARTGVGVLNPFASR